MEILILTNIRILYQNSNDDTDNGVWVARLAAAVEQMSFGSKTIMLHLIMMMVMMMMMLQLMMMLIMEILMMMTIVLTLTNFFGFIRG